MIPLKSKELYKITAEVNGVEELLVERLVTSYWKEVKDAMVECKGHNIIVTNFCTFSARDYKVKGMLDKYNNINANLQPTTFQKFQILQENIKRIEKLTSLQNMINKDKNKKILLKNKRNERP